MKQFIFMEKSYVILFLTLENLANNSAILEIIRIIFWTNYLTLGHCASYDLAWYEIEHILYFEIPVQHQIHADCIGNPDLLNEIHQLMDQQVAKNAKLSELNLSQWIGILFEVIYTYRTGKYLSEAFILASSNPQYEDRLFIELWVRYMKIPSSKHVENMLRT